MGVGSNIKNTKSEFDKAGAGVKNFEKTTEGAKAKLTSLGDQLKAQSQKVEIFKKSIKDTEKTLADTNKAYEEQKKVVSDLKGALDKVKDAYGDSSKEAKVLSKELKEAEKALASKEKAVISTENKLVNLGTQLNNTEADIGRLKAEIKDTNKSINSMNFETIGKNLTEVGNNLKTVGGNTTSFGSKLLVGVSTPIIGLATLSVKASNSLKEMQQKSQVVFGDMTEDVRKWSAENERTFGLGSGTIEGYASQIADLTQGMGLAKEASFEMSKGVVDIGVKLENWGNTGAESAMEDIKKAVAGSHEAVEKYGIKLNDAVLTEKTRAMGLGDTFSKLTEAEKAQVRYEAIVSSSQNAIDYWNEGNRSMAFYLGETKEQLGNVTENIGMGLLPVVNEVTKKVADATAGFAKWSSENPELLETITKVALAIALIAPAILIVGKIIGVIGTIAGAFGSVSTALAVAGGIMPFFTATILPVIATVVGVIGIILLAGAIKSNFEGIKEALGGLYQSFNDNLSPIKEGFAAVWGTMQAIYETAIQLLFSSIGTFIQVVIEFIAQCMPGISTAFQVVCDVLSTIWDSAGAPIFGFIVEIVDKVVQWFKQYMPQIAEVFNSVVETLSNIWNLVGKPLFEIIKVIISVVIETLKPIIESLVTVFGKVFDAIKIVCNSILNPVIDMIATVIKKMIDLVKPHMDTFKECISEAMDFVLKPIQWVIDKFGDLMDFIGKVGDKVGSFISTINPFKSIDMGVNIDDSAINPEAYGNIALSGQFYNARTPRAEEVNSILRGNEAKVDNSNDEVLKAISSQNNILTQMLEALLAEKTTVVENNIILDGRSIAKGTAKFMEKEISLINKRAGRLSGGRY